MSNTLDSKIRQVDNGYIITDVRGYEQIAFTLIDAARLIGEPVPDTQYITYASGYGVNDLVAVKAFAQRGENISAIKKLRECFGPTRLGLREAKDIIEQIC
jgi:ribosomal protein L7/L12